MPDSSYGGETLSAFFDTRAEAETAIERLRAADVSDSSIRLQGADSATASGGEDKGFLESLSDFFSGEDSSTYAEGIRRGGYLVCVMDVMPASRERVMDILEETGAVDLDERERSWREEGWTGSEAGTAGAYAGSAGAGYPQDNTYAGTRGDAGFAEAQSRLAGSDEETLQVVEENLRVGKRDVAGGRVRIRSYVREEPVTADVELQEDRVEIERRPVDRAVTPGEDAFRERSIEAEEHHEEAVISKEARVVEEIGMRKTRKTHTETVSDTVRHTDVEVERDDDDLPRR